MTHAELAQRVAELEAVVARFAPPPPVYTPTPAPQQREVRPVPVYTLQGSGNLPRDPRELRRLIEVVALAHGAVSPSQTVPPDWVPQLRRVAAARARGVSWREALVEAELTVPDDLTDHTRAVRAELNGLWDRLLPLVGMTLSSVNDPTKDSLRTFLRRALT